MKPSPITDEPPGDETFGVRLAVALLCFVAALFALGVAWMACGGTIAGWLLLPAWAAAAAVAAWASRPAGGAAALKSAARVAGVLGLVVAGALAFGASCFDVSWDGQVYHQPAVLALADGWNPLWQSPLSVASRPDNLWINHYPKAAWIAQAILFRATGSLEAAKGLQLLPLVAAALLVYAALRARGAGARTAGFATALIAGNPVALAQLFSFYSDGMGASLTTALLALYWHWRRRRAPWLLLAQAAAIALIVNLKFTGLVYVVLLCAGLATHAWLSGRDRRAIRTCRAFVLTSGAAVAVATLALGFNPYITNFLRQGHPFYPLMGQGAVDIITNQLVPGFHTLSRPTRFLLSLFARADEHNVAPAAKWPLALGWAELRALSYPDLRIGGFGPFFGVAIVGGAALLLGRRRLGITVPVAAWALAALLAGIAFCNPALWWARYVPHLWLLPAGLVALALSSPGLARAGRAAALALGGLLALNLALVGGAVAVADARASVAIAGQLDRLRDAGGPVAARWDGFDAIRARLRERAIAFDEVQVLPCRSPEVLLASRAAVCPLPPPPRQAGDGVGP